MVPFDDIRTRFSTRCLHLEALALKLIRWNLFEHLVQRSELKVAVAQRSKRAHVHQKKLRFKTKEESVAM